MRSLRAAMTPERALATLPPVPPAVAPLGGAPRFGAYAGELPHVDLTRLGERHGVEGPLRVLKHKRWQYALVATREVACLLAVMDLGYSAAAFASAVALETGEVLADVSLLGAPRLGARVNDRPGEGLEARFRSPGAALRVTREPGEGHYRLALDVSRLRARGGLRLDAELHTHGAPDALTVIAPVDGDGRVNVTQKRGALSARGTLEAGGRRWALDGGVGGLDYTQGLLARRTAWRWAFATGTLADGTPLSLNLAEGFNEGPGENALWVGDTLHPLPRVRFEYREDELLDPWHLRSADGRVDLTFRPLWAHREERDLKLVTSRFAQPVGHFSGRVQVGGRTLALARVPGVTERQDTLW